MDFSVDSLALSSVKPLRERGLPGLKTGFLVHLLVFLLALFLRFFALFNVKELNLLCANCSDLGYRLLRFPALWGAYILQALTTFPVKPEYAEYDFPFHSLRFNYIPSALTLVVFLILCLWHWRKGHLLTSAAGLSFLGCLLPVSGFYPIFNYRADRFLYLPLVFFSLHVVLFWREVPFPKTDFWSKGLARGVAVGTATLIIAFFFLRTMVVCQTWSGEEILWRTATLKTLTKRGMGNYAAVLEARGNMRRSLECWKRYVREFPEPKYMFKLGMSLAKERDNEAALACFAQALSSKDFLAPAALWMSELILCSSDEAALSSFQHSLVMDCSTPIVLPEHIAQCAPLVWGVSDRYEVSSLLFWWSLFHGRSEQSLEMVNMQSEMSAYRASPFERSSLRMKTGLASIISGVPWSAGEVTVSGTPFVSYDPLLLISLLAENGEFGKALEEIKNVQEFVRLEYSDSLFLELASICVASQIGEDADWQWRLSNLQGEVRRKVRATSEVLRELHSNRMFFAASRAERFIKSLNQLYCYSKKVKTLHLYEALLFRKKLPTEVLYREVAEHSSA